MEAICSSETSVETQRTTWRRIPEDDTLHKYKLICGQRDKCQYICRQRDKCLYICGRTIECQYVGFEVLSVVVMKSSIFWDVTLCTLLKVNWRFGGTCCLHLQDQRISQARNWREAGSKHGLFFGPEDGCDMFLRNVSWLSTAWMALYPGTYNCWSFNICVTFVSKQWFLEFCA
jgi:hypothetical protein